MRGGSIDGGLISCYFESLLLVFKCKTFEGFVCLAETRLVEGLITNQLIKSMEIDENSIESMIIMKK